MSEPTGCDHTDRRHITFYRSSVKKEKAKEERREQTNQTILILTGAVCFVMLIVAHSWKCMSLLQQVKLKCFWTFKCVVRNEL